MTARAGAKLVAEYQAKRITELESEVAEERAERRELIRSLLVTLEYPDPWERRVTKALEYLRVRREVESQ